MGGITDPIVLSIDIGTSSIRSQLYDAAGRVVENAGGRIKYAMSNTDDGGAFIDLNELCEMVYKVIDVAVDDAQRLGVSIAAVACCTFWHSLAGIDHNNDPCTPMINWNDTRPEIILDDLHKRLDADAYTSRTGCPVHASYHPAKITWMHQSMPEIACKVRHWMSAGEYLMHQITGRRACSYSMASATGLLDSANLVWDQATLAQIPAEVENLSPLCDAGDGVQNLTPQFARRWPALQNAIWHPALGDGACSNIGCGGSVAERMAVMIGTSGAMRIVWRGEYRKPPAGLWCYRVDGQRPIQGGALSNGGNLFGWMKDAIDFSTQGIDKNQSEGLRKLDRLLHEAKPDGHGLTFLPFLAGQRSPRWNPHSTGSIHGLRLSTKPADIVQAGLEAVAYRFKMIHDLLSGVVSEDHSIIATGGGLLQSPAWVQILADVLGRTVYTSTITEASCRGAALLALESLGAINDVAEIDAGLGDKVTPDMDAHLIYQSALQRHIDFENRLRND